VQPDRTIVIAALADVPDGGTMPASGERPWLQLAAGAWLVYCRVLPDTGGWSVIFSHE